MQDPIEAYCHIGIVHPMAFPESKDNRVVGVGRLPCCGDSCYAATRDLFEMALKHGDTTKAS